MPEITIQYFDGCPHWHDLRSTVKELLAELDLDVNVDLELIESPEKAVERHFRGSPTLLVNGVDPFADEAAPYGLSCRVYRTDDGFAGVPTRQQIREALSDATP